ncbi:hypothetical protein [Acidocella aminolytica]|uniref:Glycosyl transferase n=1 Tax=Acidocella aminolytica 101 = DSM 11237 TaxID=1120923 RepID=A0A0D6PBR6_9PROT|nr:hypothetical protein [Acidocella aminolytica]GAN79102.1 glycosyl transferase [Acidocella aminolytica 101 = DSM 11237]SHE64609.1 hypothetical protein SAMN02746095_00935 [Acidocella aminolytica 101 = DSM 11237]
MIICGGRRLGHSPSALFDEPYYLDRNLDVAELVGAVQYGAGFDHFCEHGWRGASPHELFNEALYAERYDDMTLKILALDGCYGCYDRYLPSEQREQRIGHFLLAASFYRAAALAAGDGVSRAALSGWGLMVAAA